MTQQDSNIQELLTFIYGAEIGSSAYTAVAQLLSDYQDRLPPPKAVVFDQQDAILITYGNQVQAAEQAPLQTLSEFCRKHLADYLNTIHILPFSPYSSDDGFSVIDYKQVDPALGDWEQIKEIGSHFRLMFDAVINHISAHSSWFQAFLKNDPRYQDYFTVVDPGADLSAVFRPRNLPLLTPVETAAGLKHVWTTFSSDQIDLNYRNPNVLLEIIDTLLFYIQHGADLIRLDAIAFMWKEIGTSCLHLPQTHAVIQLMRAVLDEAAPQVALITETNVPHRDNISYFGDGHNEAQMVYNFSLPPLTLHAFHSGDATALSGWAAGLDFPSDDVTFFNFLASHDGIGLTPLRGILSQDVIVAMGRRVEALGGRVSYKKEGDGTTSPYELNINYLDALCDPDAAEDLALISRRFLASQAVMLALRGVPGIYFHSLFGSRSWHVGLAQTGQPRTINRQKLQLDVLEAELAQPGSLRQMVFGGYRQLLRARASEPLFHPLCQQEILALHPAVFAVKRIAADGQTAITCLQNVSNTELSIALPAAPHTDIITGKHYPNRAMTMAPYQYLWLKNQL